MSKVFSIFAFIIGAVLVVLGFLFSKFLIVIGIVWIVVGVVGSFIRGKSQDIFESSIIPPQYRGLPSEVVEELWVKPYSNTEGGRQEIARRERALEAIRAGEAGGGVGYEVGEITGQKIEEALENLSQDFVLIVHQTDADIADKIMNKDAYFGRNGLEGTALSLTPKDIQKVLPELDKKQGERQYGMTHKGADAMVIMAVPKNLLGVKKGISQVDDIIIDKYAKGEISEIGLPNQFVYGYYNQGKIQLNKRFKPSF